MEDEATESGPNGAGRRKTGPILRDTRRLIRIHRDAARVTPELELNVTLAGITARLLDSSVDAGNAGDTLRLMTKLQSLLAALEPRETPRDPGPSPAALPAGDAPATGLDAFLGAGPTLGNRP